MTVGLPLYDDEEVSESVNEFGGMVYTDEDREVTVAEVSAVPASVPSVGVTSHCTVSPLSKSAPSRVAAVDTTLPLTSQR